MDDLLQARIVGADDSERVALLQRKDATAASIFGAFDVGLALESALLTILVTNDERPVAFVVFNDRLLHSDFGALVQDVQHAMSASTIVSAGNTVAITCCYIDNDEITAGNGTSVLQTALHLAANLLVDIDHFLIVAAATRDGLPHPYAEEFIQIPKSAVRGQSVFVMPRASVLPDLLVRTARVEDHDDLVPVFESRSEVVQETFGTYFLAEVIENQTDIQKVLVGEGPDGRAVGLLAASTEIETDILTACFDLSPFGGLVKRTKLEIMAEERQALLNARTRRDWYSLLQMHISELQPLFDSIMKPSNVEPGGEEVEREDVVSLKDLVSIFDSKGDSWGFSGVGNMKMGSAMMLDLDLLPATVYEQPVGEEKELKDSTRTPSLFISRHQLNTAVEQFAARREQGHRRARIAKWYATEPITVMSSVPRGRRIVVEEFDKMLASMEHASAVASKEAAATAKATAADSGSDHAAKSDADKHAAAGAFAGIFRQAKASHARKSSVGADGRRGSASGSVPLEKQPKVGLIPLGTAVTSRLSAELVVSVETQRSRRYSDDTASVGPDGPAEIHSTGVELMAELLPIIQQLVASNPASASVSARPSLTSELGSTSHVDSVETHIIATEAVARSTLIQALELWEQAALSSAIAPKVLIGCTDDTESSLLVPAGPAPQPSAVAKAAASIVSGLLNVPHAHVPRLLEKAAVEFVSTSAAVAAAKAAAEEEERRRKEAEEAAKKRKAKGTDASKKTASAPRTGAATPIPIPELTVDPAVDPAGAIAEQLMKPLYANGFVLTGLPIADEALCIKLNDVLSTHNLQATACLYLWVSDHTPGHDTTHTELSARKLTHRPSERMLLNAAATLSRAADTVGRVRIPAGLRCFGIVIPVDGHTQRVVKAHQKVLGTGLIATSRAEAAGAGQGITASYLDALKETSTSALLLEGVLFDDPSEKDYQKSRQDPIAAGEKAQSNAFAVTLFCLAHDYEARFVDLLAGAFEAYPDREFCVLTQPHTAPDVPMLRRFVAAAVSTQATFDQTLYICHRDSLASPSLIGVRRYVPTDRLPLLTLVSLLPDGSGFMDAIVAAEGQSHLNIGFDGTAANSVEALGHSIPRVVSFVAELDKQLVCAAVFSLTGCSAAALDAVSQSFDIEQFINPSLYIPKACSDVLPDSQLSTFASLLHIVCNPSFAHAVAFFLRQAMRQYFGRTALLYRQGSSPFGTHIAAPLPPSLKYLTLLVPPRRMPELSPSQQAARGSLRESYTAKNVIDCMDQPPGVTAALNTIADLDEHQLSDPRALDHCLYLYTPPLSVHPQPTVNTRIVVVGASDAAIACVSSLLLASRLNLPHVTVVSAGGLPQPFDYFSSPAPFVCGREFTSFELSRLPISSFVRVVDDVVMKISRSDKNITLASGSSINYDYLILLPGLTEPTWATLGYASPTEVPAGMHCLLHANALASLIEDVDALVAHESANPTAEKLPYVVFGSSMDALVSINALIDRGVPGNRIVFVQPPSGEAAHGHELTALAPYPGTLPTPASTYVQQKMLQVLTSTGVRILYGRTIASVNSEAVAEDVQVNIPAPLIIGLARPKHGSHSDRAEKKQEDVETIAAALLICADRRDVDPRFFDAVNFSGIVYDGRLVVDHNFRATDPAVFGGGSVAKFSRKYRAAHFLQYYDSRESGSAVAAAVQRALDPSVVGLNDTISMINSEVQGANAFAALLPKFSRPKTTKALLPTGLHFLRVRLPDYDTGTTGRELVTGLDDKAPGGLPRRFVRLVLDRFDRVVELEYAGTEAAELHNLGAIVGHQSALLNGLIRKYDDHSLVDVVDFLRGEWATAIYHDRFESLIMNLRSALVSDAHLIKLLSDVDAAMVGASPDEGMAKVRKAGVGVVGAALPAGARRKIEMQVLAFLRAQRRVLSAYFVPAVK